MDAKIKIQTYIDIIELMEDKINEVVDKHIPSGIMSNDGMLDDAQWFCVSTEWDCPESPFGWCMYHILNDKANDDCVFCHQPKERK